MKPTRDEAGLTQEQRETLRATLEAEARKVALRRKLRVAAVAEREAEVTDEADDAARSDAQDVLVTLAENERLTLVRINAALERLSRGEYGLDVESGEPIGYERLKLVPWATRAAHQEERRERAA